MTEKQIADALRAHLAGTPDAAPILFENAPGIWDGSKYAAPVAPFWAVSMVKTPPERIGLADAHIMRGRLVVAVMAKEGDTDGFTETAETQAEQIVSRFAADRDLIAGDGIVTINDEPYHDEGYRDGAYWRVNVHVRWTAIKQ
jgi:hypothetical protein